MCGTLNLEQFTPNFDQLRLNLDQFRPNLGQRPNLNQKATGSINTEQFGTPSTGNAPSIQYAQPLDTSAFDKVMGGIAETGRIVGQLTTRDFPEFLRYPYRQLSYSPGGDSGGGGGGDGYGTPSSTDGGLPPEEELANIESAGAMTPEERQNRLRRLMASRYGRSQTVLTGGTGVSDFGI